MRVKIKRLGEGLYPSDVVVSVETKNGPEGLVVDDSNLDGDMMYVGWPVGQDSEFFLVELPRETFRGSWRVWISRDEVLPDEAPQRRYA